MKIDLKESVSVEDIAEKAGVSSSMVYRVMNGKVNSSNAKHQKIRKLLQETGYSKQRIKSSGNILCVSGTDSQHAVELASILEKTVKSEGFEFISVYSSDDNINSFVERFNISGAVFISRAPEEEIFVPTVVLNRSVYSGKYSYVDSDEMTGLVKALTYLKDHGHKKIGFFDDYRQAGLYPHARRFFAPQAYQICGIQDAEKMIFPAAFKEGEHPEAISNAVEYFFHLSEPPTAILTPGSNYAPCFYDEIKSRGLRIPEDISVVGFDDTETSRAVSPFLTVLEKPMEEMAKIAFKLLMEITREPNSLNRRLLVEPRIVERESVRSIK
jgi:LacI family xylobiose transport system transcriptional regulator